jgi:hypothetical protein
MIGLMKDLGVDASLLETVWAMNERVRDPRHKDWENGKIPGVKS